MFNGVSAQDGGRGELSLSASGAGGRAPGGGAALGSLLYSQTANETSEGGLSMTFTEIPASIEIADDFEVTDEVWDVDGVVASGFWYYDDPTAIDQMTVTFYQDSSGMPGAVACAASIATYSDAGSTGYLTAEFSTPCQLEQGTYWVSAMPGFDSDQGYGFAYYRWYWTLVSSTHGSSAMVRDPSDLGGGGILTWTALTSLGLAYTDMSFEIYGEVGTLDEDDPDPVPPPEPAIHVPNIGTVMVTTNAPTRVYEAPGGGVLRNGGQEVWFPRDADGNGYDTYTVTRTVTLDNGEVWLGVFMGTDTWVYLPYDAVIPLTWLDVE
jgi:hypothetical protein